MKIGDKVYWSEKYQSGGIYHSSASFHVREGRVVSFSEEVVVVLYYSLGTTGGGTALLFYPHDQVFLDKKMAEEKAKRKEESKSV